MTAPFRAWVCLLTVAAAGIAAGSSPNLLINGDFAAPADAGQPPQWAVVPGQNVSLDAHAAPPGGGQALRVDIVKAVGSSLGEIRQSVKIKPGAAYRVDGLLKATKPKLAVLGIKLRKAGKETVRLATDWNGGKDWTTVSCAFNAEDADEVQVLCRWRQSAKDQAVGQTVWFAGLTLKEAEASAAPAAGAGATSAEPWTELIRQAATVKPAAPVPLPLPAAAGDLFLTPDGAGARSGRDWANALPGNATGVLQAAWDALLPGHTCHVGSGLYVNQTLNVTSGGTGSDALKRLSGEDTGNGLPWLVGDWSPQDVEHGSAFLSLGSGVGYCAFEHLRLARYHNVVFSKHGRHQGLRLRDVNGYELRFGVFLCGGGYADKPDEASHDIEITDCSFIHFTKSAVRLQGGNYDVRVLNCTADAGGKAWMKESFHIAFNIQGDATQKRGGKDEKPWAAEHDIIFVNCVARNCIYSKAHYWQGDGYCSERGIVNLAFINCAAFDCADGGWDVKSDNVVFVNCTSLRNKMNWRLWGTAYLYNCLSANAFKRGGGWSADGLWSIGNIHAAQLTVANNDALQIYADKKEDHAAAITLERSLIASGVADGKPAALYSDPARVTKAETAEWCPAVGQTAAVGEDPKFIQAAAGATWNGEPANAFDSQRYGRDKGYASSMTLAWRARPAAQLAEAARGLLKHTGWDDLKRRIEAASAAGK